MKKKELERLREQLKAENPELTDEQIDQIIKENYSGDSGQDDAAKQVTYECKTRCTFNGQYYREGDRLISDEQVPDFFVVVEPV